MQSLHVRVLSSVVVFHTRSSQYMHWTSGDCCLIVPYLKEVCTRPQDVHSRGLVRKPFLYSLISVDPNTIVVVNCLDFLQWSLGPKYLKYLHSVFEAFLIWPHKDNCTRIGDTYTSRTGIHQIGWTKSNIGSHGLEIYWLRIYSYFSSPCLSLHQRSAYTDKINVKRININWTIQTSRLYFFVYIKFLESSTALDFITGAQDYSPLTDNHVWSFPERRSVESKDLVALEKLEKIVERNLRTKMKNKIVTARIQHLFTN